MSEKESDRKDFEDWAKSGYHDYLKRDPQTGKYMNTKTERMWQYRQQKLERERGSR
jgi:hypothetical protein